MPDHGHTRKLFEQVIELQWNKPGTYKDGRAGRWVTGRQTAKKAYKKKETGGSAKLANPLPPGCKSVGSGSQSHERSRTTGPGGSVVVVASGGPRPAPPHTPEGFAPDETWPISVVAKAGRRGPVERRIGGRMESVQ